MRTTCKWSLVGSEHVNLHLLSCCHCLKGVQSMFGNLSVGGENLSVGFFLKSTGVRGFNVKGHSQWVCQIIEWWFKCGMLTPQMGVPNS